MYKNLLGSNETITKLLGRQPVSLDLEQTVDNLPNNYKYDLIFIFKPWEEIYKKDETRIEEFSEAKKISPFIYKVYNNAGIQIIEVPNLSIEERVKFILNSL